MATAEHTFVERINNGKVKWINVQKGFTNGDRIEMFGKLHENDAIVQNGSDEYRDGSPGVSQLSSETK